MGAVGIITILIPIYYLIIGILSILGIYYLVKVVSRYLKNGKLQEERLKIENEDIKEIKERLTNLEAVLRDVG